MYRFWESIIRPLFDEIKPNHIVEIGAEKGLNTLNILEYCRENNSKLTSIDPLPQFDIDYVKRKYSENFTIYEDLSLNCLSEVENFDVILIDGDHNWYTVFNELNVINSKFQENKFPFVILHDVSWPYGRRDMYYNPDTIPFEFLNPYKKLGIYPNKTELVNGGLNNNLYNAISDNTPKNGVFTALEDFINSSGINISYYKIDLLNGLAIVFYNSKSNNDLIKNIINNSDIMQIAENYHNNLHIEKNKLITNLNKDVSELSNINNNLLEKEEDLKNLINLKDSVIDDLTNEVNDLVDRNKNLTKTKNDLIDLKDSVIDDLTNEVNDLVDRNKNLTKTKLEFDSKEKKLLNELDNYENKFDEFVVEFKNLKQEIKKVNAEVNRLNRINRDNQRLIRSLKSKNEKQKNIIAYYESSNNWKIPKSLRKIKKL